MIYFKHKQTNCVYKAHTLRQQFINQWNGSGYTEFDPVIASIVYENVNSLWSGENRVMQFLADYDMLIPEYNVFGKVADEVRQKAL